MREEKKDTGTKYDKSMVNRLARATGHLKSIRGMVEEGRDCSEVLIQLAAVRSAVNGAGKEVLHERGRDCEDAFVSDERGRDARVCCGRY